MPSVWPDLEWLICMLCSYDLWRYLGLFDIELSGYWIEILHKTRGIRSCFCIFPKPQTMDSEEIEKKDRVEKIVMAVQEAAGLDCSRTLNEERRAGECSFYRFRHIRCHNG